MTDDGKSFRVGRVIANTFRVVGRNFWLFLILAAAGAVVSRGLALLVGWPHVTDVPLDVLRTLNALGIFRPSAVVAPILRFAESLADVLILATLLHAAACDLQGRRVSPREDIAAAKRVFWSLLAISLLFSAIAQARPYIEEFVLPIKRLISMPHDQFEIALWARTAVELTLTILLDLIRALAVAAAVMEQLGPRASFARIPSLTRGRRGAILALWIAFVVMLTVLGIAQISLAHLTYSVDPASGRLVYPWYAPAIQMLFGIIAATFGAAVTGALYQELRGSSSPAPQMP